MKHVSPEKSRPTLDIRDELMDQIRQGMTLKKVDSDESATARAEAAPAPGIAGMLQRALQERGVAMGMSSSDESDGDDDEWDD